MAKKPAPKPVRKPAPKAPALRRPDMAPINAVRNPNFELEMARQNYANLMADQQARLAAQGGDFTQGRLMGAPSGQFGGLGGMTADQAGIPADQRRILDDLMARGRVDDAANQAKAQDFLKTQKPIGGSIAGPIFGSLAGNVLPNGALANPTPEQLNAMRMQQYNQFLGQGIQRSNTMNQDSAAGFANLQPGMQPTQPAMPVAGMGMGMQQPRQAPAPRKFSTFRPPPARLG